MEILGIDIGGSGIKGALVDIDRGKLAAQRVRRPTPESLLPEDVLPVVAEVIAAFDNPGPIGVGYPAVVVDGRPRTPFTAHQIQDWVGYPVSDRLAQMTGRAIILLNDADAAGLAEMRFGAGRKQKGVVVVVTLGTGIGSALFIDGRLVPNTEFGALYLKGHDQFVEQYAADSARTRDDLKWGAYARRLNHYFHHLERLISPRLIIIGGGVSRKHERFIPRLTVQARVVPAHLRNRAGIIGAALAAAEKS